MHWWARVKIVRVETTIFFRIIPVYSIMQFLTRTRIVNCPGWIPFDHLTDTVDD